MYLVTLNLANEYKTVIVLYLKCSWTGRSRGKMPMNSYYLIYEALAQLMKVTDVLLPRTFLFHLKNLYFPLVYWFLVIELEWLLNIFIWELGGGAEYERENASVLKGKLMGWLEKNWREGGSLYLGNDLQFDWRTERLARKTGGTNEKSIQSQVNPLMDEEDTLIDEKALCPVASWLPSSLFLACSTVERFSVTNYGIYDSEPAD